MRHIYTVFATLLWALFASCGAADEPAPTNDQYDDVAVAVGKVLVGDGTTTGEVVSMGDAIQAAQGNLPDGLTSSGSGSISGVRGGLTYRYLISCKDAAGILLTQCDLTTDTATVKVAWEGNIELPRYQATLERSGRWDLTDIQSGTASFSGEGDFRIESEFQALLQAETRYLIVDYQAEYDGIAIDIATREVLSGSATFALSVESRTMSADGEVEADFAMELVVTFLGNDRATLEMDGKKRYELNLATGSIVAES